MGDRHRCTGRDLPGEDVEKGPLATEHVAESHAHVRPARLDRGRRGESLCYAFRVSEHPDRVDRLVGGNVHQERGVRGQRRLEYRPGTEDVRLHGLSGELLQDGHPFEGRRVKDDVRPAPAEQPGEPSGVPDVREEDDGPHRRGALDAAGRQVKGRLVPVEHHEALGPPPAELPAQLRPDVATGSGDRDPPAAQEAGAALETGACPRPAENPLEIPGAMPAVRQVRTVPCGIIVKHAVTLPF